tara:strand:- start:130 stop:321 length:192 start_codon:yes stop_codon:yes gene_type:complete
MNDSDSRLRHCIKSTISDAINQLHKVEGEDRCSRMMEIIEWLVHDYDELDIDWYEGLTNNEAT